MENIQRPYSEIDKLKQQQMLKIVSSSFYRELVKYGVNNSDIVSISTNLLDYVTNGSSDNLTKDKTVYPFNVNDIKDEWQTNTALSLNSVTLKPLFKDQVAEVAKWLKSREIENTFIAFLPKRTDALEKYLFGDETKKYFAILYEDQFIGIIGAERIDKTFRKLEMKKFVGAKQFRGKGIGKSATFLFLYYAFSILEFNKVFIHSMDTNIKNINLNSNFGFNLEGLFFNEVAFNGNLHDVIRMGLLREKWLELFWDNKDKIAI